MCQTRISAENASPHSAAEGHGHDEKLRHQQSPAVQRLTDHPGDRADEQHRQTARHRYQSDHHRRLGGLIREDPGNQQLEPAHRIADSAGKPQA
jgi:hypothetical protein